MLVVIGILLRPTARYNGVKQHRPWFLLGWVTILVCQFLLVFLWMRLKPRSPGAALAATVWISLSAFGIIIVQFSFSFLCKHILPEPLSHSGSKSPNRSKYKILAYMYNVIIIISFQFISFKQVLFVSNIKNTSATAGRIDSRIACNTEFRFFYFFRQSVSCRVFLYWEDWGVSSFIRKKF